MGTLNISNNPMSDNFELLGKALLRQKQLALLDLSGCCLTALSPEAARLLTIACHSAAVDLRRCHMAEGACTNLTTALASEGKSPAALDMSLNGCGTTCMEALGRAVSTSAQTTSLKLNFNNLGDRGIETLCRGLVRGPSALTVLHLADNNFAGPGLVALAAFVARTTTLAELDISGNSGIMFNPSACAEFGAALGTNSSLVSLTMCALSLTGDDVAAMVDAWLAPAAHAAASAARGAQAAEALLNGSAVTAPPSAPPSAPTTATTTATTTTAMRVSTHGSSTAQPSLQRLNVAGSDFQDQGAAAFARLLSHDRVALRELDLSGNMIGDEGTRALAASLQTNTALRRLVLRNNEVGTAGALALGRALGPASRSGIEELDLSRNHLRDDGTLQLCMGLRANTRIKALALAHNCIGRRGAQAVGTLLELSTSLERLSIEDNNFDCQGIAAVTLGLRRNLRLREIDMRNVGVDAESCPKPDFDRETSGTPATGRIVRIINSRENRDLHHKAIEQLPHIPPGF